MGGRKTQIVRRDPTTDVLPGWICRLGPQPLQILIVTSTQPRRCYIYLSGPTLNVFLPGRYLRSLVIPNAVIEMRHLPLRKKFIDSRDWERTGVNIICSMLMRPRRQVTPSVGSGSTCAPAVRVAPNGGEEDPPMLERPALARLDGDGEFMTIDLFDNEKDSPRCAYRRWLRPRRA